MTVADVVDALLSMGDNCSGIWADRLGGGKAPQGGSEMVTRRPTDEGAFGPDGVMKFFLYLTGILVPVLSVLPWSLPVGLLAIPPGFERSLFMLLVHVPLAVIVVLVLWWAPRYYSSITYSIQEDWLIAEGGVLWRRRARLPVDRVQLVDVHQGPLQRRYGVASVSVFTAATGQSQAELRFVNIRDADRLRDRILALAAKYRTDHSGLVSIGGMPLGETGEQRVRLPQVNGAGIGDLVLEELRAIRRLLEKSVKE